MIKQNALPLAYCTEIDTGGQEGMLQTETKVGNRRDNRDKRDRHQGRQTMG